MRYTRSRYNTGMIVLTAISTGLLLLIWPAARHASSIGMKALLAILAVLPLMATIGFTAWFVWHSDELEQRLHLGALGIAAGVVAALSLAGGYLAAAGVYSAGADILIWVFPALCMTYGIAFGYLSRRYGCA